MTCTPRVCASVRDAAGQLLEDRLSFHVRIGSDRCAALRSESRGTPDSFASSISFAACSRALEGMQPAVQADAAQAGLLLHQDDLLPFVGRVECGRVSAGAGADHYDIGMIVFTLSVSCRQILLHRASSNCSNAATRSTMNRAALAPSMIR